MAAINGRTYSLLGALAATVDQRDVVLGSTRQRALLAALLINRDQILPRERILEMLWDGSPPETAMHSIEVYISRIRGAIEPRVSRGRHEVLIGSRDGYRLLARGSTDIDVFEKALTEAAHARESADEARAERALELALGLWRGPALAGLHGFRFAQSEALRLEHEREAAVEALIDAKLALGKHHEASSILARAILEQPLSEAVASQMMLARYRAGEAAEAVDVFYSFRRNLVDELAVEPSSGLQELLRRILNRDPTLSLGSSRALVTYLPAFKDVFVGRAGDLAVVSAMIQERRLVTLTGIPGVGKTRLAIEVAGATAARFSGGARMVELVSIADGERFYGALADALGLQEHAQTPARELALRFIADRKCLLLLDNCEYVAPDLKPILGELFRRCANLHVLATSLVKLDVPNEKTWEIEPLKLPRPAEPMDLRLVEAVALFCDRAAESDPSFSLEEGQHNAIRRISNQLEGIPLAIELTAPRLKEMSLSQLAESLESELGSYATQDLGRPLRHRSLETAIATSFSTLTSDQEQLLLAASLFRGGIDPNVAVTIGDLSNTSADGLGLAETLAERSLLRLDESGRGSMLDSVRRFSERRLDSHPNAALVRKRFVDTFAALARRAGSVLEGAGQVEAQRLLRTEKENVGEALAALLREGEVDAVMNIAGLLGRFWWVRGHISEGQRWLTQALGRSSPPSRIQAEALRILGYMNWSQGRLVVALQNCQDSMTMSVALGDPGSVARSHYYLGIALHQVGRIDAAQEQFVQGILLCEHLENSHLRGLTLDMLGRSMNMRSRSEDGAAVCAQALSLLRDSQDVFGVGVCLVNLAESLGLEGRHAEASSAYIESMQIFRNLGSSAGAAYGLLGLAMVTARSGRSENATRLIGAAEAHWESVGYVLLPEDEAVVDATIAAASVPLGQGRIAILRAEGREWAQRPDFFEWVQSASQGM